MASDEDRAVGAAAQEAQLAQFLRGDGGEGAADTQGRALPGATGEGRRAAAGRAVTAAGRGAVAAALLPRVHLFALALALRGMRDAFMYKPS